MARFFRPAEDRFAGIDIPRELIELLAQYSDEYSIFIGAQFRRQADIVLFSRNAAHVIEVKNKQGTITIDEDGRWLLDDGTAISNIFAGEEETPPIQARNTAKALEEFLKKVFRDRRKVFRGKVPAYVLIPYASTETRTNLRKHEWGWVWIVTSLDELQNSIAKRDKRAAETTNFAFDPEDIQYIAQRLRMVPTDEICGMKITPIPQRLTSEMPESRAAEAPVHERIPHSPKVVRAVPQKRRTVWPLWLIIPAIILLCCFEAGLLATFFVDLKDLGRIFLIPVTPTASRIASPTHPRSQNLAPEESPTLLTATPIPFTPTGSPIPIPSPTPIPTPPPSPTPTTPLGEWSVEKNGFVLTVEKIEILDNRFRIWMRATNSTRNVLTLPLFKNFFVVDNLGNQYEADPFSSTFPQDVAPGATVSGYAEIRGTLSRNATSVKVIFSQIYGSSLFREPLFIEGIPVR